MNRWAVRILGVLVLAVLLLLLFNLQRTLQRMVDQRSAATQQR